MQNTRHKKIFPKFELLDSTFYSRGFTFVETLVAISILLLAVVGPLFLSSQGLRAARIARDQITANYLAQEAVEYIRFRRDTNVLGNNSWLSGNISLCLSQECIVDVFEEVISPCDGACDPIRFNNMIGLYGYGEDDWEDTKFVRSIRIDETTSDQEALIAVTVSWQDGLINRSYTLTEHLLNWQ